MTRIGALLCLGTIIAPAAPAAAAAPTTVAVADAVNGTLGGWYMEKVPDPASATGNAVKYDWAGTVHLQVTLPADATTVTLRVRGDQCAGAPAYTVTIDSAVVANDGVAGTSWTDRSYSVPLVAGLHSVDVTYTNDYSAPWPNACDRNLYLDTVTFAGNGPLPNNPVPGGFVHQSGTGVLDGAGHPVRLHGVDLGGWLLWEGWLWGEGFDYIGESAMMNNLASLVGQTQADQFRSNVRANYITSNDFHAIAADGFNVARVPFNYRLLEDDSNPFVYKQSGWDVLDQLVSEAKQAGVYLILDMHAAPCSQMMAFVSDWVPGPNYLWSSTQCQDRMVAMWKAIAARYANQNIIAGYDLLGETIVGDSQLLGLYQRVTAAIRQVDPNHLIIYEGNDMARTFGMFTKPLDSNEMLSFHDYAWAYPGQDISVRMAAYDAAARRLNAPLYAGEFGESTYSDDQKYVTTFNNDPLVAAWTEWTWKQAPGYAALQNIQQTPASQKLIDWIDNPSRPQPTPAEATQGMSDFINAIQFANTLPNAMLRGILAAPGPPASLAPAPASKSSAPAASGRCGQRLSPHRQCPSRRRAGCRKRLSPRHKCPSRHGHRCPAIHHRGRSHRTRHHSRVRRKHGHSRRPSAVQCRSR